MTDQRKPRHPLADLAARLRSTVLAAAGIVAPVASAHAQHSPTTGAPTFFDKRLIADLTGDGRPDTMRLRASGAQPDSLSIVFTIRSDNRELYRQSWMSADELIDPPEMPPDPGAARDSLARMMRARLEEVFRNIRVEKLDSARVVAPWEPGPGDCMESVRDCISWYLRYQAQRERRSRAGLSPEPAAQPEVSAFFRAIDSLPVDSAAVDSIVHDIATHTRVTASISYGYETSEELAWSRLRQRFFIIWASD